MLKPSLQTQSGILAIFTFNLLSTLSNLIYNPNLDSVFGIIGWIMDAKEDNKHHFYSQKSKFLTYKTCGKQKAIEKTSKDGETGSTMAVAPTTI